MAESRRCRPRALTFNLTVKVINPYHIAALVFDMYSKEGILSLWVLKSQVTQRARLPIARNRGHRNAPLLFRVFGMRMRITGRPFQVRSFAKCSRMKGQAPAA